MKVRNLKGMSLVEILVVVLITAIMVGGGAFALMAGNSSWFTSEAAIQLQENLRKVFDQLTAELRQTRLSKITITVGAGANTSDNIKFSIPVICHVGDRILDANGDVAHWGATTRWGCRDAACMDADDNCATVEYANIQYELIAGDQLVRKVLDNADSLVRQDVIANNISKIQASLIGAPNQGVHIDLTAKTLSVVKRDLTMTVGGDVYFRNK